MIFKKSETENVVPTGELQKLNLDDIKTSFNNPRVLFDQQPLFDLKESIKNHGVLVPITVYKLPGQNKYAILDGERRYRCCKDLQKEGGRDVEIPANIVKPPTKIAGLIYMFSIHNFREQWELMPTALGLKELMDEVKETDNKKLSDMTGLSPVQVERCKILLAIPEKFQRMSLEPDSTKRIPSNFWIELAPVLETTERHNPEYVKKLGREKLIEIFVEKYENKKIKSIIHFRKIIDADKRQHEEGGDEMFAKQLENFISDPNKTIPEAFDSLLPSKATQKIETACDEFIDILNKHKDLKYVVDEEREVVLRMLKKVQADVKALIDMIDAE